jgi:hypothetical protein
MLKKQMIRLRERIENWYQGEFVAYENDPYGDLVFIGGRYNKSFSAKTATVLVNFWSKHWKYSIGVIVTVAAAILNYLK